MKSISGKDFAKLLEKKGWVLSRVNGSHHVYIKEGHPARISIPIHSNQDLKKGLLKHFLKVSKIDDSEL